MNCFIKKLTQFDWGESSGSFGRHTYINLYVLSLKLRKKSKFSCKYYSYKIRFSCMITSNLCEKCFYWFPTQSRNLFDQMILPASENVKLNLLSMGLGFCKYLMLSDFRLQENHYSRLRNKHRGTLINFWTFFQGLRSY